MPEENFEGHSIAINKKVTAREFENGDVAIFVSGNEEQKPIEIYLKSNEVQLFASWLSRP